MYTIICMVLIVWQPWPSNWSRGLLKLTARLITQ